MAAYPRRNCVEGLAKNYYIKNDPELRGGDYKGRKPPGSWIPGGLLRVQLWRHIRIYANKVTVYYFAWINKRYGKS